MALFTKLRVKLLYSTAYHLQTDGFYKRINQAIEIALRFFIHGLLNPSVWPEVLPKIQSLFNNMSSSITGKTPNEITYRFSIKRPLNLLAPISTPDVVSWLDVANAIAFVTANQKEHYN